MVLLFPDVPALAELREHREAAARQVKALDLEIVRERARTKARARSLCVARAERGAKVAHEWRQITVILAVAVIIVSGVLWAIAALLGESDATPQWQAVTATALLFVSLLLTFVSLTALSPGSVVAVTAFATAVAIFASFAALPPSTVVTFVHLACMLVMATCWAWVWLRDPEVVARRKGHGTWYVAVSWASESPGVARYSPATCECRRCDRAEPTTLAIR